MDDFIEAITEVFENNQNEKIAAEQAAYLKGKFSFYGLKTPIRRDVQKPFFQKDHLPEKKKLTKSLKSFGLNLRESFIISHRSFWQNTGTNLKRAI